MRCLNRDINKFLILTYTKQRCYHYFEVLKKSKLQQSRDLTVFIDLSYTMTSRKASLRSPQYAQRISLQQYQEEAEDYTRQQLNELAEFIRKNKQATRKTNQYVVVQRPMHLRSKLIQLGLQSIVIYILILCIANTSVLETNLQNTIQHIYCPSEGKDFIIPPVVLGASLITFVLWITSMNLENKFIQRKADFLMQFARVLLQLSLPLLVWSFITMWTALIVRYLNIRALCLQETKTIAETLLATEISKEFFLGIALPVAKATSSLSVSLQGVLTIAVSLLVIQGILGTLVDLRKRQSQVKLVLLVLSAVCIYYFVDGK